MHNYWTSVHSLSRVQLFATPWIAACQAFLSITNSWSLPKFMSIESVISSNHLILSSPSPPAFHLSQHQGLFKWVRSSHHVAKVLGFSLNISPSNEYTELISFRIDWLDLFANKGPSSQGYSFSSGHVCMWGWTVKKAERQRIDAFELWFWRRLLRVPWTARRSNQCILKEISPEYSLEGLMLKLKRQHFGNLM